MPTYDYRCDFCEEDIEIFHSMTEPAVTICPQCEKPGLKKLIGSGAGIIFKGSGFYETDYKRKSSSASASSNASSSDSGSASASTKEPG